MPWWRRVIWCHYLLFWISWRKPCWQNLTDPRASSLMGKYEIHVTRGKSLLESWGTTFLPDLQLPLIFVWIISNFLCMCSNSMASAHVVLKYINQTKIKGGFQSGKKVVPHDSKSGDLPLILCRFKFIVKLSKLPLWCCHRCIWGLQAGYYSEDYG